MKHGHNNKANLYSLVLQKFNHNNIPLEYFLIHVCLNSNYIKQAYQSLSKVNTRLCKKGFFGNLWNYGRDTVIYIYKVGRTVTPIENNRAQSYISQIHL